MSTTTDLVRAAGPTSSLATKRKHMPPGTHTAFALPGPRLILPKSNLSPNRCGIDRTNTSEGNGHIRPLNLRRGLTGAKPSSK